jgi:hypothetical protein
MCKNKKMILGFFAPANPPEAERIQGFKRYNYEFQNPNFKTNIENKKLRK